jgi:adenosylhomocysteine nucleosidase
MAEAPVGLIAALPEEVAPLLRQVRESAEERLGGLLCYRFPVGRSEACLVLSGMGMARAATAAGALVSAVRPRCLVSFGFGGAVLPGPEVGDLVVAERLLHLHRRLFAEQPAPTLEPAQRIVSLLAAGRPKGAARTFPGTIVSTSGIVTKSSLVGLLPAGLNCPVLDMETVAVARVAAEAGIPLVALRAVSDPADEELGFSLEEITDRELNIRLGLVLLTMAKRPPIVPQFLRLARNSRTAGESLAQAILALLTEL